MLLVLWWIDTRQVTREHHVPIEKLAQCGAREVCWLTNSRPTDDSLWWWFRCRTVGLSGKPGGKQPTYWEMLRENFRGHSHIQKLELVINLYFYSHQEPLSSFGLRIKQHYYKPHRKKIWTIQSTWKSCMPIYHKLYIINYISTYRFRLIATSNLKIGNINQVLQLQVYIEILSNIYSQYKFLKQKTGENNLLWWWKCNTTQ